MEKLDPIEGNIIWSITDDSTQVTRYSPYASCLLYLRTEKLYGSSSHSIATEISLKTNEIDIEILGIRRCSVLCDAAVGPATAYKPINIQQGNFDVNLRYQNMIDQYKLIYSSQGFAISIVDTNFTEFIDYDKVPYWLP